MQLLVNCNASQTNREFRNANRENRNVAWANRDLKSGKSQWLSQWHADYSEMILDLS